MQNIFENVYQNCVQIVNKFVFVSNLFRFSIVKSEELFVACGLYIDEPSNDSELALHINRFKSHYLLSLYIFGLIFSMKLIKLYSAQNTLHKRMSSIERQQIQSDKETCLCT